MRPRNQAEKTEQTLLALALALLGIALAWHLYAARRRVLAEERTRLADQVRIIDANLGRQLGAVDNALVQVRDDLPVLLRPRDGVSPLDRRLRALSGAMPGVRTLFVMDAGGRVVASNRKALIGQDLHERGCHRRTDRTARAALPLSRLGRKDSGRAGSGAAARFPGRPPGAGKRRAPPTGS